MKKRTWMSKIFTSVLSATLMLTCASPAGAAEEPNGPPNVIPAIREWEGSNGYFTLRDGMKVVLAEGTTLSDAKKEIIAGFFDSLFGMTVEVTQGEASDGDILLMQKADDTLGTDGYTLNVTETAATVTAPREIGLLYGVITILQSCMADGFMPAGTARDYSAYEVRGGMLDVARAWIPMDYLTEITKYCAWFKINQFHVHVSDNNAFRLESDIEGLSTPNEYYTKEEYRAYQREMAEYGIKIITEIDTPAHSACFASVVPELMMDSVHLDIENPDAIQFVKDLLAEYLAGEDPVILSDRFHIGTDEYTAGHEEQMRAYTDEILKYVRSLGYTPMFWGSFSEEGQGGFYGTTPVTSDAEAYYWAYGISDHEMLLDMGYPIINIYGPILYVVPGGNYGFADYYHLESLYESWQVNHMAYGESSAIDANHPQLLGGSFALWNDLSPEGMGFSYFDIFDRIRGQVCLMAEKTWCGQQTKELSAADFVARYEALSLYGGDVDPGRHRVETIDGEIPAGTQSFGWPYVASMQVTPDFTDGVVTLLDGKEGTFYITKNGKASIRREDYVFTFDHAFVSGQTVNLKLIADKKETVLVIDDTYYYPAQNSKNSITHSTTFVLPLETVGEGVKNLKVEGTSVDLNEFSENRNYARNCVASASGLEVDDGRFTPDLAVDGNNGTRVSFARDQDEQWLLLDLGEVYEINRVEVDFQEHISDYSICVSEDGETFTEVARIRQGEDRAEQTDTVEFKTVDARYVRYEQHKRFYIEDWNAYYSGGIQEIRVLCVNREYETLLREADALITRDTPQSLREAYRVLNNYVKQERKFTPHLEALIADLQAEMDAYKQTLGNGTSTDETNAEESTVSEISKQEDPKKGISPLLWAGAALAVCVAVGGLILVWKKKKK